ncbi:17452_t:CDS:2 [Cetraspora pellucida]|uniref:17452_t:CDS:1 n=1 Tax=Cetraspora pellucida TaxID=1433469 RepID=A0ACA9NAM7_9GLOM|nr:17452_t:CDS:2 [Cetraspora pellucida]
MSLSNTTNATTASNIPSKKCKIDSISEPKNTETGPTSIENYCIEQFLQAANNNTIQCPFCHYEFDHEEKKQYL